VGLKSLKSLNLTNVYPNNNTNNNKNKKKKNNKVKSKPLELRSRVKNAHVHEERTEIDPFINTFKLFPCQGLTS
jgi:DNA modification methylase